jgi:hypothetical protein
MDYLESGILGYIKRANLNNATGLMKGVDSSPDSDEAARIRNFLLSANIQSYDLDSAVVSQILTAAINAVINDSAESNNECQRLVKTDDTKETPRLSIDNIGDFAITTGRGYCSPRQRSHSPERNHFHVKFSSQQTPPSTAIALPGASTTSIKRRRRKY